VALDGATAVGRSQSAPAEKVTPVRAKRSWPVVAGSIALVVAGAVAGGMVYTSGSHTEKVFVVSQDVTRGSTIQKDDLTTIDIAQGQSTSGLSTSQASTIIGKTAAVDLPKGSLVTNSSITDQLAVPAGKALVGLALKPSQMPAQQLVAGDQIDIVPIADPNNPQATQQAASTVRAVVSDTTKDEAGGVVIVDAYVPETSASDVTSRAAAGVVAIYLAPSKGDQ